MYVKIGETRYLYFEISDNANQILRTEQFLRIQAKRQKKGFLIKAKGARRTVNKKRNKEWKSLIKKIIQ